MNMTTGGTNYSGGIHGVCKSSWRFEYLSDYEGSFENMTFDGRGTETWPEGDKYAGEFLDGWYHGQGTYTRPNGEQYVGEWKKGQTNGHGIFTRPNGDRFVGEFKGNELGAGTFYDKDGKRISGWGDLGDPESDTSERPEAEAPTVRSSSQSNKSSSENHYGTYVSSSGMDYTGDLRGGVAHGQGMARFANGDKYVGEWCDGKRHGKGVLTLSSGLKLSGEFRLDEYVSLGSERD